MKLLNLQRVKCYLSNLLQRGSAKEYLQPDVFAAITHRSFDSMSAVLSWMLSLLADEFIDYSPHGKSALEIGAGKFLAHAFGLYVCGYGEVVSVDKFRQVEPESVEHSMQQSVLARRFLSSYASHDEFIKRTRQIIQTEYCLERLKDIGIHYRAPLDIANEIDFKEAFDLVFSYTVLEHIPPEECELFLLKSMEAIRPGGHCIHFIDLEDHREAKYLPFDFLSCDSDWSDDSYSRGNRLRYSEWKRLLNKIPDMDIRFPYVAVRYDSLPPARIDPVISCIDEADLRTSAIVLVGRKDRGK